MTLTDHRHSCQASLSERAENARDLSVVDDASRGPNGCTDDQQSLIEVTSSNVYLEDLVAVAEQREIAAAEQHELANCSLPANVDKPVHASCITGQFTSRACGMQSSDSETNAHTFTNDSVACLHCTQVAHSPPGNGPPAFGDDRVTTEATSSSSDEASYETATDYESWRALYIMNRLEEAVRKRPDILQYTPADLQPEGSAKTKSAFVCQPPWTEPVVTELSEAVRTRWEQYCTQNEEAEHATFLNRGSSAAPKRSTSGSSSRSDSLATHSTSSLSPSSTQPVAMTQTVALKKRKRKRKSKKSASTLGDSVLGVEASGETLRDVASDAESLSDEGEPAAKYTKTDDAPPLDSDAELNTTPASTRQLKEREKRKRQKRNRTHRTHKKRVFDEVSAPPSLSRKIFERTESTSAPQLSGTDLHTNPGVYTGPPRASKGKVEYLQDFRWPEAEDPEDWPDSVKELLVQGFKILHNDKRRAQVITDVKGVILAVKALAPKTKLWEFLTDSVDEQLALLHEALSDDATELENRTDGAFKHVTVGVSMGKGQKVPMHLGIRNEEHAAVRAFIEHPDVRIFADQMSKLFKFWFPKLFELYQELEKDLEAYNPRLRGVFPGFPMHAQTPNTGRKVRTRLHTDEKNAHFGMCIIGVFGRFNHKKHGLLILRELKIAIQLAPGDIVFIPSALITHGNTELADDETRRSWTTFTAGGLFRFRDAGFATERDLARQRRYKELAHFKRIQPALLAHRVAMHLTLDQLKQHHGVRAENAPE